LRPPISSPPTTRRVTVEVFHPASTPILSLSGFPSICTNISEALLVSYNPSHGPRRKHSSQQYLYCCMRIRCRWNVSTKPFPSSGRLFLLIKLCFLAANVGSFFVSRSLPRKGSIHRNIKYPSQAHEMRICIAVQINRIKLNVCVCEKNKAHVYLLNFKLA
jgi:hypothetical protein